MDRCAIVLVMAAVMTAGCGGDPSGPGASWNDGHWTGLTSTGLQVGFDLEHPTLTDWTLTVTHYYAGTSDTRTWTSPQLTVGSDSSFSWSDSVHSDSLQYSFSMTGSFTSGDSAAGEWDSIVYYQLGSTSGTDELGGSWTAGGH